MKVLKFYADWCSPCKSLSNVIAGIPDLKIEIDNINIEEDVDAAVEYTVRSIPTCILLDDQGKEIRRASGGMTAEEFKKFVGE